MVSEVKVIGLLLCGLSAVFSFVLLGVVAKNLQDTVGDKDVCYYNSRSKDTEACDFSIAMGSLGGFFGIVFSILALLELVVLQAELMPKSTLRISRLLRLGMSVFLALMFQACFVVMVDNWRMHDASGYSNKIKNGAVSGIIFAFLSILSWVRILV